jgi:hypothetical protein
LCGGKYILDPVNFTCLKDPTLSPNVPACFPADAQLELSNGTLIKMAQLQVNDIVRTGANTFSRIYMFSHQDRSIQTFFTELSGNTFKLLLTGDHFLYVNGNAIPASQVVIGDQIEFHQVNASITRIQSRLAMGLYNPHTLDGDLIVDGIRTTVYAISPKLAHFLLSPIRVLL